MANKCKVEKETRKLIEGVTELVKFKGNRYKFRTKNKKTIKRVKRSCVHWVINKHKEKPSVTRDSLIPGNWKCDICKVSFPILPYEDNEYDKRVDDVLEIINQIQFWAVSLGGDASDTKMFIELKRDLPRFKKVASQVRKQINKRQKIEENRGKSDSMIRSDAYSGYTYSRGN